jgi:hypothetical protein
MILKQENGIEFIATKSTNVPRANPMAFQDLEEDAE